jgi:site-specific DNA-methyltransferase (adenine-specific)
LGEYLQLINNIVVGDSYAVLKALPDNSVDSCVTDPPYGLSSEPDIREVLSRWMADEVYQGPKRGFMGKEWDSFVPSPLLWKEVFRVLKPGGHILCFAGTRTQDLMTIALRLAGFEIRDVIEWLYFSGFPKSMDVGKMFDRKAGAEREVVGYKTAGLGTGETYAFQNRNPKASKMVPVTIPTTELARQWEGWGSSLKPAHEPIIMGRKPLAKSICNTVELYGTGALNIDGCRIGDEEISTNGRGKMSGATPIVPQKEEYPGGKHTGRFPANCVTLEPDQFYSRYFNITSPELSKKAHRREKDANWKGDVIDLEESRKQIAFRHQYCINCGKPKFRSDYEVPCCDSPQYVDGQVTPARNTHPTVKPVTLMAWLCRLVTPPGGTVLDPFAGSGSTAVAARREGFNFIAIEREPEYAEIARKRAG